MLLKADGARRLIGSPPDDDARFAMTLIEMVIVICLIAVGLFLLSGWMSGLRAASKHDLAVRLLTDLDRALSRYHRATGCYPVSRGPDSAIQATDDLLDHERSCPLLEALPQALWRGPGRRTLVDPWGTELQFFDTGSGSPYVQANNNRPVFVSAGPDRIFGNIDPTKLGDDLRSDDPGAEGFRLHQLMREALSEGEDPPGEQEDD